MKKYRPKATQSPGWSINGSIYTDVPNELTHWEKFLIDEEISTKDIENNPKVIVFISKNSHLYFIPTAVLKMYGVDILDQ